MEHLLRTYLVEYLESARSSHLVGMTLTYDDAITLKERLVREGSYLENYLCITPKEIWVNLNTKELN